MLTFVEQKLDDGWDADPNAPEPHVTVTGSTATVRFRLSGLLRNTQPRRPGPLQRLFGARADPDGGWGALSFLGCSRWRWDDTNDHEWYKKNGHGRYSGIAPKWGKFYELAGEDPIRDAVPWELIQTDTAAARHFLFYFRDETLEFMAEEWSFTADRIV